jgi:hypothetical protein
MAAANGKFKVFIEYNNNLKLDVVVENILFVEYLRKGLSFPNIEYLISGCSNSWSNPGAIEHSPIFKLLLLEFKQNS